MASNHIGEIFKLTTFGESHGPAIGGVIDGCPAGLKLDMEAIRVDMQRRRPGQSELTTQRKEDDEIEWMSGLLDQVTTGSPIAFVIRNKDQRSTDYDQLKDVYRPGHADYTYTAKYGLRDHRGGGRSSARETAVRVVAGAIAKQFLAQLGVKVQAFVSGVKNIHVPAHYTQLDLSLIESNAVRCPHPETAQRMIALIEKVKEEKDSVGGIITCVASGVAPGWGEPIYDKLNAQLASAMFSINAVKSFEMGDGLSATLRNGSENNDGIKADGFASNHDGGVQGGISNGKDVWMKIGFKPTSTIGKEQLTLNSEGERVKLAAVGRHDPCVLPRAVVIVESMAAIVLFDSYLRSRLSRWSL